MMADQSPVMKEGFEPFYLKNTGLIHKICRKVHNRTLAMGAAIEFKDLEQEATIIMMKAYQGFDPSKGFTFSTYFTRAAYNGLNKFVESYARDRAVLGVFSMQSAVDSDGDTVDMESTIDGHHGSPEQMLEAKQLRDEIFSRLSPVAAAMLNLIVDPTEHFENEWNAHRQVVTTARIEPTLQFVEKYMHALTGLPAVELRQAATEISALQRRMNV